ncbi:HU family DNA-binding protein [Desulfovibrio sp. OttesenSCG-928-G15]|nr:HU family DNA-binding protein [Desulfovibrio sp. OttesenSCG-928-G15]
MFSLLGNALKNGDTVAISGFGSFKPVKRAAQKGRIRVLTEDSNPRIYRCKIYAGQNTERKPVNSRLVSI